MTDRLVRSGQAYAGAVSDLRRLIGGGAVITDPEIKRSYEVDWLGKYHGETPAVLRPANVEQVAAVVAYCSERGIQLVPQGGNTGLVGGSVPLGGELVLSLSRLADIQPIEHESAQVTVGAGALLATVQQAAALNDLDFGVDLGARASATLGGMIATNAGGLRTIRFGVMRAQVMGVEAVLGSGSVVSHLAGLPKDNTGYDYAGLVAGSEGTLAVITRARLRLVPRFGSRATAFLALGSLADAIALGARLRSALPDLECLELVTQPGLELVGRHLQSRPPFDARHPVYLVVECAAHQSPLPALVAALESPRDSILDSIVAEDEKTRSRIWMWRESHVEATTAYCARNNLGPPQRYDLSLPHRTLAAFVEDLPRLVAGISPGAVHFLYGHLGDGNVHVTVAGGAQPSKLETALLSRVAESEGSISAEHGIGSSRRGALHLNRSLAEIDLFRSIKRAFDPNWILNPNVLITQYPPA